MVSHHPHDNATRTHCSGLHEDHGSYQWKGEQYPKWLERYTVISSQMGRRPVQTFGYEDYWH